MYRDVPASSGTCVTAKQHPCTSCPSSRAPLAAECDSGVMAHESGNNGKRGMFRLILRSRFHFPCNNFVNQKGRCVMLSLHLELYIFRALCKHFFCTSDFMMGGDGKSVCSEVRTVSTTSFHLMLWFYLVLWSDDLSFSMSFCGLFSHHTGAV